MKKITLMLSFLALSTTIQAQEINPKQQACIQKGMNEILDKVYNDCKITEKHDLVKNPELMEKFSQDQKDCISKETEKYMPNIMEIQTECSK